MISTEILVILMKMQNNIIGFKFRITRGDQNVRALMLQLFNDIRYRNDFGDLLI